jgi:hypothetical protein
MLSDDRWGGQTCFENPYHNDLRCFASIRNLLNHGFPTIEGKIGHNIERLQNPSMLPELQHDSDTFGLYTGTKLLIWTI